MMRAFLIFCIFFQAAFGHSETIQKYTVEGKVTKPGVMKWEKGMTLGGAIEAAGGVANGADLSRVKLSRNGKSFFFDLGSEPHREILIYSNDVVEVHQVSTSWLIGVDQALRIAVSGAPIEKKNKIDAEYVVDSHGMLKMWKVGPIKAQGKTKSALAKELAEAYQKAGIIEAGVFQVFAESHTPGHREPVFTIGGEVKKPGVKEWKEGMTLQRAVDAAGGVKALGVAERVKLYRNGKPYMYDLTTKENQGFLIYPRDIIEVPTWTIFLELRMQKENEEALKNSKRKEGEVAN